MARVGVSLQVLAHTLRSPLGGLSTRLDELNFMVCWLQIDESVRLLRNAGTIDLPVNLHDKSTGCCELTCMS